jgi:hypothetical protein
VVSALLECTHDDLPPGDDHLFKSLDTLRLQRKEASKPGGSMEERESVGFCISSNGEEAKKKDDLMDTVVGIKRR